MGPGTEFCWTLRHPVNIEWMCVRHVTPLPRDVTKFRSLQCERRPRPTKVTQTPNQHSMKPRSSERNRLLQRGAALEKYQTAVPLFQAAGDTYRRALTLLSIGITHFQLNEIRKALEYFNETLTIAVSREPTTRSRNETWVIGMLDIMGDVSKALDHHQRALKLA